MKKIWLTWILFAAFSQTGFSQEPMTDVELIDTHTKIWLDKTIVLKKKTILLSVREKDKKYTSREIYRFRKTPDILKHFALADGDLVVVSFHDQREIIFIVFNSSGDIIYEKKDFLKFELNDLDVRVDGDGNPIALLYSTRNGNHVVSIWKQNNNSDILNSEFPIDRIFLQWSEKKVHILYRNASTIYWTVWTDGKYQRFTLPFFVKRPQFFQMNNKMYLMAFDVYGNLYKFFIAGKEVQEQKVLYSKEFLYADDIIPVRYEKKIIIFIPSRKLNTVFRIDFDDFSAQAPKMKFQSRRLMTGFYFVPLLRKDGLFFNVLSDINFLYTESWELSQPYLSAFDWFIRMTENSPELVMRWESSSPNFAYRYLLSENKYAQPLDDVRKIPGNEFKKDNLKGGMYYFIVQAVHGNERSWVYRIPIYWEYSPAEPYIFLLNEISPRTIKSGNMEFFINNLDNVNYYATISSAPKEDPSNPIEHEKGKISIAANLKAGRYFLHIRSRDPKSGLFSSTNNYQFFIYPYNPEQDETLKENAEKMGKLQFILQKIRENRKNPEELKKWMAELKKLEKSMKDN